MCAKSPSAERCARFSTNPPDHRNVHHGRVRCPSSCHHHYHHDGPIIIFALFCCCCLSSTATFRPVQRQFRAKMPSQRNSHDAGRFSTKRTAENIDGTGNQNAHTHTLPNLGQSPKFVRSRARWQAVVAGLRSFSFSGRAYNWSLSERAGFETCFVSSSSSASFLRWWPCSAAVFWGCLGAVSCARSRASPLVSALSNTLRSGAVDSPCSSSPLWSVWLELFFFYCSERFLNIRCVASFACLAGV